MENRVCPKCKRSLFVLKATRDRVVFSCRNKDCPNKDKEVLVVNTKSDN